jgi:Kef-type K+ transport system membrane component KefB
MAIAYWGAGWTRDQAEIGGLALSTTSLAVVYAVLVETGLNRSVTGKRIMAATFVTDILTVLGLSVLFITPNLWVVPFAAVSVLAIWGLPRIASGHYESHRLEQERLRVVAFAFLTPFFFLKGGLNLSLGAVRANLGLLALLGAAKMAPKLAGVYPLARRYCAPDAAFTTLLMSTGLTFGTITSLYGLQAGIIDRTQFSLLLTVIILSAVVPTAIAQRALQPSSAEARRAVR